MSTKQTPTTSTEDSESLPELYKPSKKIAPVEAMESKIKPAHPSTADMVTEAILQLSERNGSSLSAIKKYIAKTYKLDVDKQAIYIKRYLKSAVTNGSLVQTKGKGASGSFKMPSAKQKAAMAKTVLLENPNLAGKPISPKKMESARLPATPTKKQASKKSSKKESAVGQKTKSTKQVITATPPKSTSRTKKITKSPTSKPKAPKPKKVNATKSAKSDGAR